VVLQSVPGRGRQLLSPQGVHQLVDPHHPPAAKREQRQQTVPLASAHGHGTAARRNLERAENSDLQRTAHAGEN
jgi:hypothetical protein